MSKIEWVYAEKILRESQILSYGNALFKLVIWVLTLTS